MQDGRLKSGDRLLQIGDVNVRGLTTEDVATVLRQSGIHVRMIVARNVDTMPDIPDPAAAPIIPVDQLDEHLAYINRVVDFSRLSSDADLSAELLSFPVWIIRIALTRTRAHTQFLFSWFSLPEIYFRLVDSLKKISGIIAIPVTLVRTVSKHWLRLEKSSTDLAFSWSTARLLREKGRHAEAWDVQSWLVWNSSDLHMVQLMKKSVVWCTKSAGLAVKICSQYQNMQ